MSKTDDIENYPPEQQKNMKVLLHEVRTLETSTDFYGNTNMTEFRKASTWAQSTTFTAFYMRDAA